MTLTRPLMAALLVATAVLALPRISEAGPPLICHPFATGTESVLSWGTGSGWNTPDRRYDVQRLTADVLQLLSPKAPILARMENIRRATIYAGQDPRIANELLAAVLARAVAASAGTAPDPLALFDAGYLLESYKQAAHLHRYNMLAPAAARSVDHAERAIRRRLRDGRPRNRPAARQSGHGVCGVAHEGRRNVGRAPAPC